MTQLNWGRIVLGGLLAGIVINTSEFVLNFFALNQQLMDAKGLEKGSPLMTGGEIVALNLWGFLVGLLALWLYSAVRPRFGAGYKSAIYAATAVWALVSPLAALKPAVGASLPMTAVVVSIVIGLAEINLGTLLGAWQYRETQRAAAQAGAAGI